MNEKEKEELIKKFKDMKTSELIDYYDIASDEECDMVYDQMEIRGFYTYLQEQISENRKDITEIKENIKEICERIDKIDNFWNIANKLDMILDRLRKNPYHSHKRKL